MTYRLRDAPAELRLKIFGTTSTLALGPGFTCPPLLLALGILKGTDDEVVYTEAKEVSRKVNHVVTVKNQAAFCRIDRIVLSKINYLTLFVGGDSDWTQANVLDICGCKAFIKNRIEILTIDISGRDSVQVEGTKCGLSWWSAASFLSSGSLPGFTKVIIFDTTTPHKPSVWNYIKEADQTIDEVMGGLPHVLIDEITGVVLMTWHRGSRMVGESANSSCMGRVNHSSLAGREHQAGHSLPGGSGTPPAPEGRNERVQ